MTANPETGDYLKDTDSLLRERMVPALGAEATEKFFAALETLPLSKRAKAIGRQAKILDSLFPDPLMSPLVASVAVEPVAHVIKMSEHTHVEEVAVTVEPVVDQPIIQPVPIVSTEYVELDDVLTEDSAPKNTLPFPENLRHLDSLTSQATSRYIDGMTGKKSSAMLDLRLSDKDAVVSGLIAMNQPLDKRMKVDQLSVILGGMYEGLSDDEIVTKVNQDPQLNTTMTKGAVYQRMLHFRRRAVGLAESNPDLDHAKTLEEHVLKARSVATETTVDQPAGSDVPSENPLEESEAMTKLQRLFDKPAEAPAEETIEPAKVHQDTIENVEDKRLIIDTLLSELTNETTKISFKKLLTELQFVEEMDAGHSWLGEMVTKYMGSIDIARELMGDDKFDKEAYKALQQFAGVKGRGQGEKARTLPMIAKYNNAISESDVLEYVTALLQTVQNDSNYSVPVVSHVPSNVAPITFLNHPQRYEPKQASEPVPTLPIDLWAAAVHNKPAPTSDVERAVEHVFDTAVKNNQLKRSEAFFLKDRLFSGDNRHTLDQQEEETLNKIAGLMQVLNANGYSRLDESPEAKKYLRDFTTVSKTLGVTTVGEITQRANKDSRIKLRESTIARKIVGAIQVVLEDSRES